MKAVRFIAFLLSLSALSYAGVTVSSPSNGASAGSPVHFVATASSTHPISAIMVYVDNKSAYTAEGANLDSYVTMATGSHYVVVQAWDSTGKVLFAPAMTVTISGGVGIPPNATTYANVNQMNNWSWCDKCAGPGGDGPTAKMSMTQFVANPAMDAKSAQFYMAGAKPYSSALWWRQLGANPNASNFVYDLYFYVKDPGAVQALEFDLNQSIGGKKYIFGTQCDVLGHHDWDVWDTKNAVWVKTGIACAAPTAYSWNHLTWEFQRVNGQTKFVSVSLNGNKSYINRTFWPRSVSVNELNVAFQMDGTVSNVAYSTWLDKVNMYAW
jgi:hypothetical protein